MTTKTIDRLTQQIVGGSLRNIVNSFIIDRRARDLSPRTLEFYSDELRYFSEYCDTLGVWKLEEIDSGVIRQYLVSLSGHRNQGGVHASFRAIHALFLWTWNELDLDVKNPILKVKIASPKKNPLPGVPLDDIRLMIAACDTRNAVRDKTILLFLLDTGVRGSELCALNYGDIDLTSGAVIVWHGKGNRTRTVYLGRGVRRQVIKYLKLRSELTARSPLFATEDNERLTFSGLRQIVRRRSNDAGIDEPGLHDFRRCCGLTCYRNGMSLLDISRLLGHSSLEVTKRYICLTNDDLQNSHSLCSPVDNARL